MMDFHKSNKQIKSSDLQSVESFDYYSQVQKESKLMDIHEKLKQLSLKTYQSENGESAMAPKNVPLVYKQEEPENEFLEPVSCIPVECGNPLVNVSLQESQKLQNYVPNKVTGSNDTNIHGKVTGSNEIDA